MSRHVHFCASELKIAQRRFYFPTMLSNVVRITAKQKMDVKPDFRKKAAVQATHSSSTYDSEPGLSNH